MLAAVITSCGDPGVGPGHSVPHSLTIAMAVDGEPATVAWWAYPANLTATVRDRNGIELPDVPVTWASLQPTLASVTGDGVVTFLGDHVPTSVDIRASAGTVSTIFSIPVVLGLDSLRISPNSSIGVLPGSDRQIQAIRHLSNGDVGGNFPVTWESSDPGLINLVPTDHSAIVRMVAGTSTGSARIIARSTRRADTLFVSVERPVVDEIVLGGVGGCVISADDDRPWCWGPMLGAIIDQYRWFVDYQFPMRPDVPGPVNVLGLGQAYGCAIELMGTLRCWGVDSPDDPGIVASGAPWQDVASGWAAGSFPVNCAVAAAGTLWCWGDWQGGTFTGGGVVPTMRPVRPDISFRAVAVASTEPSVHFCAIDVSDEVWCWGMNQYGEAGQEDPADVVALQRVNGLPKIRQVTVGSIHTCALAFDDRVWCWGDNNRAQLNRPLSELDRSHVPLLMDNLSDIVQIAAGGYHTCARDGSGKVWCWGLNDNGQLGRGDRTATRELNLVPGISAKAIAASGSLSCALVQGAGISCWGLGPQELSEWLVPRSGNPDIRTAP